MPKVKKIRSAALESRAVRQEPLGQVVAADKGKYAAPSSSSRNNKKEKNRSESSSSSGSNNHKGGASVTALLDTKASQRILQLSQEQQLEIQAEEMMTQSRKQQQQLQDERKRAKQYNMDSDEDDEDDDEDNDIHHRKRENGDDDDDDDDLIQHDDQGYVTLADGALGLSAEDEALVAAMMRPPTQERRTLADIILEKIEEKEAAVRNNNHTNNSNMQDDDNDDGEPELPAKVVQVYTEIGKILSRYTAGKLPKAFKVIPSLSNWEQVLYLTRPDMWTPQAMYQATRIFASNLNPKMAQRFYHFVLLDAVRADITTNKKLNYHYYLSLKKSVYKPAAFFKGILLPLCQDGANCTLREAAILASVLQRVSIPVHHSAVAIHKLATMSLSSYNGATSIFIKTLLNKKYSLPAPVIASLVQHFTSFIHYNNSYTTTDSSSSSGSLPVLWHQALLVFVQRYKNELQKVAREALSAVMKKHYHYKITPEIRRELYGAQAYKDERAAAMSSSNNKSTTTSITSTGGGSGRGGSSMQVE